jgi:hypothetical protein
MQSAHVIPTLGNYSLVGFSSLIPSVEVKILLFYLEKTAGSEPLARADTISRLFQLLLLSVNMQLKRTQAELSPKY